MSEWRECLLNDIAIVTMGQSPSGDSCNVNGIGVPLLNGPTEFGIKYPIEAQYTIQPRKHSEPKDILFCVRGSTTGRMNWSDKKYAIGRGLASIRHKSGYEYNHYLKGILDFHLNELLSAATGSTFPNISREQLNKLEITCPPLPEQKAIASVLSSLDNKIDLLHRQNKTLEAMAETLFRQWFVEEARDDWERKPLTKIATFTNGLACQKYPPKKGELGLPVLKIKELNSGITDSSDVATKDVKPDYIVEHGDIIFAWSASLMVKIWSGERCVLNQHLFNVKSNKFPKWFIYEWCKYYLDEFISISQSHATTMGHIKRKDLDEAIALIPSKDELDAMDIEMSALFESKVHKLRQIQTLEKLRDTLLPKLMSGEVRVNYTTEEIKQ